MAYKTVGKLKDVQYHVFCKQIKHTAFASSWEDNLFDLNTPARTTDWIEADDDDAESEHDRHKRYLDRRNAYLIVMHATDGHPVEDLLESMRPDNPRLIFQAIHDYFYPNTTSGHQAAYMNLFNSSMTSTGLPILAWTAHVARCAKVVQIGGGTVDDNAQLAVILKGLLPEFAQIKLILNQRAGLTLAAAISSLLDYAREAGLLELTKGSHAKPNSNTYTIDDDQTFPNGTRDRYNRPKIPMDETTRTMLKRKYGKEDCWAWKKHGHCKWGKDCVRSHSGPKPQQGLNKRNRPDDNTNHAPNIAPTHAGCMLCQVGPQHRPVDCPVAKSSNVDFSFIIAPQNEEEAKSRETLAPAKVSADAFPYQGVFQVNGTPLKEEKWSIPTILQLCSGLLLCMLFSPFYISKYVMKCSEVHTFSIRMLFACILFFFLISQSSSSTIQPSVVATYLVGQGDTSTTRGFGWCADTGTNRFVTNDINDFLPDSISDINLTVGVGNGTYVVKKQGDVVVENHMGKTIRCTKVLFMPNCAKKLMPMSPFDQAGCKLEIIEGNINLSSAKGESILRGKQIDGLYYFQVKTISPKDFLNRPIIQPELKTIHSPVTSNVPSNYFGLPLGSIIQTTANDFAQKLLETHQAFGHLHFSKIRSVFGLKKGDNPHCPACAVAGSRKAPLDKIPDRSTRINHRIHVDIGFTAGSNNPFQLYVDDFSRVSHLDLLLKKEDTLEYFTDLKTLLENQHSPWKIAFVRTDNEFVYTTNAWIQYCKDNGIEHEFSPPYRHDALGVVERAMQTVGICFRCMMLQGNAPSSMIVYALVHANVIRNHSPTKANGGLTPLEKQAGVRLPVNKRLLKGVLFCLVYIHVYEEQRIKHGDRAVACVYLGFDATNNQFIAMEWLSGKIHYCGDGTFVPTVFPFRANPHKVPSWMLSTDKLTPSIEVSVPRPASHSLPTGPRRAYRQHSEQFQNISEGQPPPAAPDIPEEGNMRRSKRQHDYRFSVDESGMNIPVVSIPDIHALFTPDLYLVHTWGPEPTTWAEALAGAHPQRWILAMLAEREVFRQRNVYTLVPRSEADGYRIFKSRPVLKMKFNPPSAEEPNGSLDKFKYRLTIAAFTSMLTPGIDYKEKFASTVRWSALKLIIAQAVKEGWDLLHLDIKAFFLYGILDGTKPVFMEQPDGWDTVDKPRDQFICLVDKSMYGHPAASHCAQKELKATMTKDQKFAPATADDCVYVSNEKLPLYAVSGTHVDDILATGDVKGLNFLKETLESKFEITTKINPNVITGVQIVRDRTNKFLKLHQGEYVRELLIAFQMQNCDSVDTPMDHATAKALMLLPTDVHDATAVSKFQSLVGCFIWLGKTRADLGFTTNLLARFTLVATTAHLVFAMRALRYLKGTIEYGLIFLAGFEEDGVLSGEADADFAGDLATSRSTTGGYLKMGRFGTILNRSSLERKISTSTGQAETYALGSLTKDVVWTRQLAADIRRPQKLPTEINTDNQGVHLQATKAINHATAKHFRVTQAYIRSKCEDGSMHVNKVATNLNHADFFTKPLCPALFLEHRNAIMGPVELQTYMPKK